jgi:amidase
VTDVEIGELDGVGQAELVKAGELTALELVEAAIARIERVNPLLNFLIEPLFDQARRTATAELPAGSLAGVPIVLKDHLATCAGARHTSGSRFLGEYTAERDSELVVRYKRGGLIPVATAATCEFALLSTAESARYGACRNPWSLERTTGGSSGGPAAAVAAGCVAIAHGNDAGGSIRIPASCCGLFGLKPTRGRNPLGPEYGDLASGLWAEHVLTRSVRDSAAALDLTAGPMPGDPYAAPELPRPLLEDAGADPGRLRIALLEEAPTRTPVDRDCRHAAIDAAELCESLGHAVEPASLPLDAEGYEEAFQVVYAAGAAAWLDSWEGKLGRTAQPGELEPFSVALIDWGRERSAVEYQRAVHALQDGARQLAAMHASYDLLLSPTLGAAPVPLGYFEPSAEDPLEVLARDARFAAFTWPANASGQPAMSVPLSWSADGLPIGTHFTAAFGREDLLFGLAGQLERARPWADRRPDLGTGV